MCVLHHLGYNTGRGDESIIGRVMYITFFKCEIMASLHSLGTVPHCKVWLNSAVRAGVSSPANSLRTQLDIPSGPEDLLLLSSDNSFCTPGLQNWTTKLACARHESH